MAGASSAPPAPGDAPGATTPEGWDPRCPPGSAPLASAGSFSFPPVPTGADGPAAGAGRNPDPNPDPDPGAAAAGADAAPPQHVQAAARAEPDADQTLGAAPDPATPYGAATLLGCLHRFVRPEALGPGERWTCGRCQAERRAVKQMSICRLPPVLCLHVKRFEHTVQPGPIEARCCSSNSVFALSLLNIWMGCCLQHIAELPVCGDVQCFMCLHSIFPSRGEGPPAEAPCEYGLPPVTVVQDAS